MDLEFNPYQQQQELGRYKNMVREDIINNNAIFFPGKYQILFSQVRNHVFIIIHIVIIRRRHCLYDMWKHWHAFKSKSSYIDAFYVIPLGREYASNVQNKQDVSSKREQPNRFLVVSQKKQVPCSLFLFLSVFSSPQKQSFEGKDQDFKISPSKSSIKN